MLENAFNFLKEHIQKGDKVGVACSGGSDSVALLHFFVNCGIVSLDDIVTLNVNHKIRGEESERDSEFVKKLSEEFGVRFLGIEYNVPDAAQKTGKSIEQVARDARYTFFSKLTKEGKLKFVMTAHHREDNAESILLNIFRGCGLDGLKGTKPLRSDGMLRPLLTTSKAEINEYLRINKLKHVDDSTNADIYYTRNFLRHEVLGKIAFRFPNAAVVLANLAQEANDISDYMESQLNKSLIKEKDGKVSLDIKALENDTLGPRYIRQCLLLSKMRLNTTRKHVLMILNLRDKGAGKQLDLPGGIVKKMRGFIEFVPN